MQYFFLSHSVNYKEGIHFKLVDKILEVLGEVESVCFFYLFNKKIKKNN